MTDLANFIIIIGSGTLLMGVGVIAMGVLKYYLNH